MTPDDLQLSHKELRKLDAEYEKAAEAAHLRYVHDSSPGITRVRKGSGFSYLWHDAPLKDEKQLARIKGLVLPPAWEKVWICPVPNGHIQATGYDVRGRKQYRYHTHWNALRSLTKFHRLYEFGKVLPALRKKIQHDLRSPDLNEDKVLATVISLMEHTSIRVGNAEYEKMNGSYGLTTLKDKHVDIVGPVIDFSFKGKKGVYHKISLRNKKLAKIVKACRDIPGKELFQYYDKNGDRHAIDSGRVNHYIKTATEQDFSAKDFRLWAGSLHMIDAFKELGSHTTITICKQNVVSALDTVSKKLGNTRTVCKKYYVHPGIIKLYEDNELDRYIRHADNAQRTESQWELTPQEEVLLKILKNLS